MLFDTLPVNFEKVVYKTKIKRNMLEYTLNIDRYVLFSKV